MVRVMRNCVKCFRPREYPTEPYCRYCGSEQIAPDRLYRCETPNCGGGYNEYGYKHGEIYCGCCGVKIPVRKE